MISVDKLIEDGVSPEGALAAMVIKLGLDIDGPCFLTFPCAEDWIEVLEIEASVLWKAAIVGTDHEGLLYEVLECHHAKRINRWWYIRSKCSHVLRGELEYQKVEGRPGYWVVKELEDANNQRVV